MSFTSPGFSGTCQDRTRHQHFVPAHLALSQDLLEQDTLQHLEQDGAGRRCSSV